MEGNQIISQYLIETDSIQAHVKDFEQRIDKWDIIQKKNALTVLQKLLVLQDDESNEKELRLQIVDLLLNRLETSDNESLKALLRKCDRIFVHQGSKKYIVDGASIESGSTELGRGDFGIVSLGRLRQPDDSWIQVAVERSTNDRNNKTCLEEAILMAKFDHKNVIKILAFQKSPPRIAMEYMDWGDFRAALRKHHFTDVDLLNAFHDIASGMEHIAVRKYIHRDLWLKNVFTNSKKQCKVGDFGYCKYVGDTNGYLDAKDLPTANYFVAPEAMKWKIFSTKTDVWSMGLLIIWDAYIAVEKKCSILSNSQEADGVFRLAFLGAEKLPKPLRCPLMVHTYVCKNLLNDNPKKRPTFTLIKKKISHFLAVTKSACLNYLD